MPRASTLFGFGALCAATLAGCAKDVKPTGPVITPFERSRDFAKASLAPARYSAGIPPLSKTPVLPFMGFGASFDLDVALGLKSDDFDMVEVARIQTKDGPMWLVLETDAESKEQTILASVEDIDSWMPELPLERKTTQLVVQDKTTTDGIDLSVKYDNTDNRPVEMTLQGQPAEKVAKKRNGNLMGHSPNALLAGLDVSSSESLFLADVRIDDQRVRARKLGGLVPFQYTITQSMGGVATGEYFQQPVAEIDFDKGAKVHPTGEWVPAAPPPPAPVIPEPMNPAGEDVVLLAMSEWVAIPDPAKMKALEAQEAKLPSCVEAGKATNPDFAGVVGVDFYVKDGRTWEVTIDPMSTGSDLVFSCAQTIAAAYTFEDKALDGSVRVVFGHLPEGHEARNDLEKTWQDAQIAAAAEKMDEKAPADPKKDEKKPAGTDGMDDLPEGEDLLGDPEEDTTGPATTAAPLASFDSVHTMANGKKIAQRWSVQREGERVWVRQVSDSRTLAYEYLVHGDDSVLELRSIQVVPYGAAVPAAAITFSPALPDLRRPFNGKVTSKFVIDVGGDANHVVGTAESSFGDAGAKVTLTPEAPSWAASRPIVSTINYKNGMPHVSTRRVE
ncbi:MAG: hypothetical protein H6734_11545 [Alphaproteobacteria bacterium]|nr:hypothetical protein [Alphaproteobacteria bacterium]